MGKDNVVVGLDMGTTKIGAVIGEVNEEGKTVIQIDNQNLAQTARGCHLPAKELLFALGKGLKREHLDAQDSMAD